MRIGRTFDDTAFREAMVHFFGHAQYAKRRGYALDVNGMEATLTRRDTAVVLRFPTARLRDRFALSKLGV